MPAGDDRFMSMQEAAYALLSEAGAPMRAREIAEVAFARGLVASEAQDPVRSLAQTLEKTVREGHYNHPPLKFVRHEGRRLLAIATWRDEICNAPRRPPSIELCARIPQDLRDQVMLAVQARIAPDFDATVAQLLARGLEVEGPRIRSGISGQLKALKARTAR